MIEKKLERFVHPIIGENRSHYDFYTYTNEEDIQYSDDRTILFLGRKNRKGEFSILVPGFIDFSNNYKTEKDKDGRDVSYVEPVKTRERQDIDFFLRSKEGGDLGNEPILYFSNSEVEPKGTSGMGGSSAAVT